MNLIKSLLCISLILVAAGCASMSQRVPSSSIKSPTSQKVYYFTQRDSIPKDVVYRPESATVIANQVKSQAIDPAVIGAVVSAIPEITTGILQVRNNVVLRDLEFYVSGVELKSEDLKTIIESMRSPIDASK